MRTYKENNNNNTVFSYNFSSTCCGLGILYPSSSNFAIFFPSFPGYGEPPKIKRVLSIHFKGLTLVNIFLQYNSSTIVPCLFVCLFVFFFSNKFSDWGNIRWPGSYKTQRQNWIPQRMVHHAYFMTTCQHKCHFCWHVDAKVNGLVINLATYQSWRSHRGELRSSICKTNEMH